MLGLVVAVLDDREPDPPWRLLVEHLAGLLHGTGGVLAVIRRDTATELIDGWVQRRPDRFAPETSRTSYLPQPPLTRHYATTGDRSPVALSDLVRHPDAAVDQLVVPLDAVAGALRVLVVGRAGGEEFSARDKAVAGRLQPVLTALDAHLRRLRQRRDTAVAAAHDGSWLADAPGGRLTPRELAVLTSLSDGLTGAAAGRRLGISPHTVNRHLEHLYRKLGTRDRLSTVLRAQSMGLLREHQVRG
jgi:DNA-binding CsgD family transcriptional regulator